MNGLPAKALGDLVEEHRRWFAYDNAKTPAAVRSALAQIETALSRAATCIAEMSGDPDIAGETPVRAAWWLVNSITQETGDPRPLQNGIKIEDILRAWARAAAAAKQRVPGKRYSESALKMTASSLYTLRTDAGLKCTSTVTGDAVTELVGIAKKAGDRSVTDNAAAKALKAVISNQGRERRKKAAI